MAHSLIRCCSQQPTSTWVPSLGCAHWFLVRWPLHRPSCTLPFTTCSLRANLFWFQLHSWCKFRLNSLLILKSFSKFLLALLWPCVYTRCSPSAGFSQPLILPRDICWDKTSSSKLGKELTAFVNLCSLHFLLLGILTISGIKTYCSWETHQVHFVLTPNKQRTGNCLWSQDGTHLWCSSPLSGYREEYMGFC